MPPQSHRGLVAETPGKRAVLYLRVSSAGQVNTDYDPEGISLPAQRAACQKRAAELGAVIVGEYLDAGLSATTVEKRPKFNAMMARIKAEHDVDYVIVYARSRMHRNSVDAAITKRDLRKAGTVIVSIMDYTEDNAIGDLVATVLDGVNEYQSRASGADISYKMGQKVARGGAIGRAPIGYLNVREQYEGREVRTIAVDPGRAPLVRLAFELYATGTYSFQALRDALTDAGLRTRPTRRHPAGNEISVHKLGTMLRDRFYIGYVAHKGTEYEGRHEPVISDELFAKVREVLDGQRGGGTRARVHHHYLKGTVWCARCRKRLILTPGKSHTGTRYFYYFCTGRKDRSCDLPYLPVEQCERAVENHYTQICIPAALRHRITQAMHAAMNEDSDGTRALREQITKQLTALEVREDQYLDLVGNPDWPAGKLSAKMRGLRAERDQLRARLAETQRPELSNGARSIEQILDLLTDPHTMYRQAGEASKRVLNQAFFTRIYLDTLSPRDGTPTATADALTEPIEPFVAVHRRGHLTPVPAPSGNGKGGTTSNGDTAVPGSSATTLLATALTGEGSTNVAMVELRGFEPLTPWMQTKCSSS
jgi:site-specific DNA recombinase